LDGTIATVDLADGSVTDAKIVGISGVKVTGNIVGNAANVTGIVAVANGGTGASTLTGYIKGDGTSSLSASTRIPVADVTGAAPLNSPTFTGIPLLPSSTVAVTQASGDNSTKIATTEFVQAATAGIALQASLDGKADINSPVFTGAPVLPSSTVAVTQASGDNSTKIATTEFVQIATSNATTTATGKIQLAGDLSGNAISPTIAAGAINSSKILDGTIATVDLADASITSEKIVDGTISTSDLANSSVSDAKILGVSGSKVSGNISGNAANVSGTVAVANGGTGATTKVSGFNALSPITTRGDLIFGDNSSSGTRLALGREGQVLTVKSGLPSWQNSNNDSDDDDKDIPDADKDTKGIIRLAGDLTGTAISPVIATGKINSDKILNGSIATVDLANASVTDAKIAGVAGSKITGNITGNAANVSGTVAVANGGTGVTTIAQNRVMLGNGTNAIQTVAPGQSGNVLMSNGTTWVSSSINNSLPIKDLTLSLIYIKLFQKESFSSSDIL
jgi:hypothetical protein